MTASKSSKRESPLSIYVVFHEKSKEARKLATTLHDWFRLKGDSGDGTEAGIPVWFRARIRPDGSPANEARIDPAIEWDEACHNAVIVLVDDEMVADRRWRYALEHLNNQFQEAEHEGERPQDRILLPVELSPSLYRLPFLVQECNPIRFGEARSVDAKARALRRDVTEAIVRELRRETTDEAAGEASATPERLTVFLSHAKADGAKIAETLRDGLARSSQLQTWYDANDLPPGYGWESPMEKAARESTAALISVVTDAYPTRYWCRREVDLARKPRRVFREPQAKTQVPKPSRFTMWTVQPAIAVHRAGSGWSRPMPQLAQVPRVGWPETPTATAERMADVVDRLLLETMLIWYYRMRALQLEETTQQLLEAEDVAVACTTWVPDPWSLVHLVAGILQAAPDGESISRIIIAYPGVGLATADQLELKDLVESLRVMNGDGKALAIELITHERLPSADDEPPKGLKLDVCVSGGGEDPHLLHAGVGPEQVEDALVRVARRLFEADCRIVYGGTLAKLKNNLTEALIDVANGWRQDRAVEEDKPESPSAAHLDQTPFLNYSCWPFDKHVKTLHKARLTGVCHFVPVPPPGVEALPRDACLENPEHAALAAHALTEMRRLSSDGPPLRVVFAGKVFDALGWLPGIAEEVLCSLEASEHPQLPLILRGFGGCADLLAEFLSEPKNEWPAKLTLEDQCKRGPLQVITSVDKARAEAGERFARLRKRVEEYREQLHGKPPWPFADGTREIALDLARGGLGVAQMIEKVMQAAVLIQAEQSEKP